MVTSEDRPAGLREAGRLAALERYKIMDTAPEQEFDDLVALAAQICGMPIALMSLVDDNRQWFKVRVGHAATQTPRDMAFCAHAIEQSGVMVVNDATQDARFADNPLVTGDPGLRFYAGAPLVTSDGFPLGTLCVLDTRPREITPEQERSLAMLARQVVVQLELRQALTRQREDERRHRLIMDSAVDYAIITMDLKGLVTSWSAGAATLMGWTEHDMCGMRCDAFFTPEDCASGIPDREMGEALSQGRGSDERWHLKSDGSRFWASGEMMPLTDDDDVPIGFLKILRDRTEARLAAGRIETSEKRWRELFQHMREGFFLAELVRDDAGSAVDYRFLEVNDAFAEQSGIPASGVGMTIRDFAKDVEQWLIDRFALTVETGEPQQFEIHVPELRRWFEVRSAKDEGERFSCLFLDITARKESEEALVRNDERLQMALTASGAVGLWDWMVDTDLLHGDAGFARLYGLDPDRTAAGVTMEQYQEHVVAEDVAPLRERIRAVFEQGEGFLVEYRLAIPGEPLRWVECQGRIVTGSDGRPYRFSGTAVDVTARKAVEEQKQLLMEELSHRVKNTFVMVQSLASQTLRGVDPAVSANLQSRLAALGSAHDVLLQKGWTSMTLSSVLERVLRLRSEGDRFLIEGDALEVNADAALSLSLLLHELTTNAIKYGALSNDAGRVRISWKLEEERFQFWWKEEGGPLITPPKSKGFGSRLVAMGIRGSQKSELVYAADGLTASFEASRASVIAEGRSGS